MNLNLLPIAHWHEFLDTIFFFKVVTGRVRVSLFSCKSQLLALPALTATGFMSLTLFQGNVILLYLRNWKREMGPLLQNVANQVFDIQRAKEVNVVYSAKLENFIYYDTSYFKKCYKIRHTLLLYFYTTSHECQLTLLK